MKDYIRPAFIQHGLIDAEYTTGWPSRFPPFAGNRAHHRRAGGPENGSGNSAPRDVRHHHGHLHNGVQGKVIEVGLLHTVILETGNWTDPGHPTGRKVSFVNSFAIEGHYFNFSTVGQWLWDEIQVGLPSGTDPYPTVEAIQKLVAAETEADAQLAEREWQRATTTSGLRSFSAAPTISVRPTHSGLNLIVRYIARADERNELRSGLYRAAYEFLIGKGVLQPTTESRTRQSTAGVG